jgi:hypothetical protein
VLAEPAVGRVVVAHALEREYGRRNASAVQCGVVTHASELCSEPSTPLMCGITRFRRAWWIADCGGSVVEARTRFVPRALPCPSRLMAATPRVQVLDEPPRPVWALTWI